MMNHTNRLPSQIWILTLSAFAIGTAEFVIAGILPQVAESLGVSAGGADNLITVYALGGIIDGTVVDSHFGPAALPFFAALVPLTGLLFILSQERSRRAALAC